MSTLQIDRLLDTVIRQGASDLHLTTGRKPTLRLHGKLRNLDTKVLDADDTVALMKASPTGRKHDSVWPCSGSGVMSQSRYA